MARYNAAREAKRPFKREERALATGLVLQTTASISARMARVGQRDTTPELAVSRMARALGLRLTRRNRNLPGNPDFANRTRQIAIFVHGCYWHRHPGCARTTTPKSNVEFWKRKFARNVERDSAVIAELKAQGYRVAIIWECETMDCWRIDRSLRTVID